MPNNIESVTLLELAANVAAYRADFMVHGHNPEALDPRRSRATIEASRSSCALVIDLSGPAPLVPAFLAKLVRFGVKGPRVLVRLDNMSRTESLSPDDPLSVGDLRSSLTSGEMHAFLSMIARLALGSAGSSPKTPPALYVAVVFDRLANMARDMRKGVGAARARYTPGAQMLPQRLDERSDDLRGIAGQMTIAEYYVGRDDWEHIRLVVGNRARPFPTHWSVKLFRKRGAVGLEFRELDGVSVFADWPGKEKDEYGRVFRLLSAEGDIQIPLEDWFDLNESDRNTILDIAKLIPDKLSKCRITAPNLSPTDIGFWVVNARTLKDALEKLDQERKDHLSLARLLAEDEED